MADGTGGEPWASLAEMHRVRDLIDDAELSRARDAWARTPYMMEDSPEEFERVRNLAWPAPPA